MMLCLDVWDMFDVNAWLMLLLCDVLVAFGYILLDDRVFMLRISVGHLPCLDVRCMLVCVSLE